MVDGIPAQVDTCPAFGHRKLVPRVCVADRKQHIRAFLVEALEDLGFIVCECARVGELGAMLNGHLPDLVVVGCFAEGADADKMLETLAARQYDGMVLLVGAVDSPAVAAARALGEQLGLPMLALLATPFGNGDLRDSVAAFLAIEAPSPPVDVAEALAAGWLELWYQPKVDARMLAVRGAEALIRMRHPHWGVVQPARFLPAAGDPQFRALSEFVISQAMADWQTFQAERSPVDISINLSLSFLKDPQSLDYLSRQLPDHPLFDGLMVEINGAEIVRDLALARDIAKKTRLRKISISIDDLGPEWPSFSGLLDFPFVEVKVDREYVSGCADDRLKRVVCRNIVEMADGYGARTVAEGVETRADYFAARTMGFDLIQGFLFGKPMTVRKFARTALRHAAAH
jgi:EAL domain-containing protein (putative c-di-GMP-specific phosphodiesterase class I)